MIADGRPLADESRTGPCDIEQGRVRIPSRPSGPLDPAVELQAPVLALGGVTIKRLDEVAAIGVLALQASAPFTTADD